MSAAWQVKDRNWRLARDGVYDRVGDLVVERCWERVAGSMRERFEVPVWRHLSDEVREQAQAGGLDVAWALGGWP